jgi:orotidine-5'-phosphate decarboxylase
MQQLKHHQHLLNKIAIAIDKSDTNFNLQAFAQQFPQEIMLKIGLEYFTKFGASEIEKLSHNVFLDLKFYDIPNTVHHAVKSACSIKNVKLLTIHAQGGKKMIEAAVNAKNETNESIAIVCVTKLTSEPATIEEIYKLTELALNSGANGIVCSAQEIDLLRAKFGNGFLAVTPGIRPKWYTEGDDQVRICTPSEAFKKGASIIVIGRPVTKSPSPQFALQQIMEEIKNA